MMASLPALCPIEGCQPAVPPSVNLSVAEAARVALAACLFLFSVWQAFRVFNILLMRKATLPRRNAPLRMQTAALSSEGFAEEIEASRKRCRRKMEILDYRHCPVPLRHTMRFRAAKLELKRRAKKRANGQVLLKYAQDIWTLRPIDTVSKTVSGGKILNTATFATKQWNRFSLIQPANLERVFLWFFRTEFWVFDFELNE